MTACAALALVSSGVGAAQAAAATITVPEACVVNTNSFTGSEMVVDGNGFTAGDSIELQSNMGDAFGTATVAPDGTFTTSITAPVLQKSGPAAGVFTLTATDETDAVTTASTSFEVANLAVATNPAKAKPSKKVTFTFSGFSSGAEIYAHYLHGKKVEATARFGRAQGPCGVLKTKAKFYPGKAHFSSYKVQFDDSRHYSGRSLPRLIATLETNLPL